MADHTVTPKHPGYKTHEEFIAARDALRRQHAEALARDKQRSRDRTEALGLEAPPLTPEESSLLAAFEARDAERRAELKRQEDTYGSSLDRIRAATAQVDLQADRLMLRMQLDTDDFVHDLMTGAADRVKAKALAESTINNAALAIPQWSIAVRPADISFDDQVTAIRNRLRKDRDAARTALDVYNKRIEAGELVEMRKRATRRNTPDGQALGYAILELESQGETLREEMREAERRYDDWLKHEQEERIKRMDSTELDHVCPHCDSLVPYSHGVRARLGTVYCSTGCQNAYNPFHGVWTHCCATCQRYFLAARDLSFGTVPHVADEELNQPETWCRLSCLLRAKVDLTDWPNLTPSLWADVRYVPGPPRTAAARRQLNLRALADSAYQEPVESTGQDHARLARRPRVQSLPAARTIKVLGTGEPRLCSEIRDLLREQRSGRYGEMKKTLKAQGPALTEALRYMLDKGEVSRTGSGKDGSPHVYTWLGVKKT